MFIPPQCGHQRHGRGGQNSNTARNCALMITDFPGECEVENVHLSAPFLHLQKDLLRNLRKDQKAFQLQTEGLLSTLRPHSDAFGSFTFKAYLKGSFEMHGISLKAAIPLLDAPSLHLGISIFNSLPKKVGYVTNISLVRFFYVAHFSTVTILWPNLLQKNTCVIYRPNLRCSSPYKNFPHFVAVDSMFYSTFYVKRQIEELGLLVKIAFVGDNFEEVVEYLSNESKDIAQGTKSFLLFHYSPSLITNSYNLTTIKFDPCHQPWTAPIYHANRSVLTNCLYEYNRFAKVQIARILTQKPTLINMRAQ